MELIEFLHLLQMLCQKHPEIEGFYTGTKANRDDNNTEYPAVRVIHPFDLIPSLQPKTDEQTTIKVQFNVRVNEAVKTQNNNFEININYSTENAGNNEINTDIALENVMRNSAARLAFHLIEWLRLSEEAFNFFTVSKALVKGVDRTEADNVTGVDVHLDLIVGNPYICEARQMFHTIFNH